jgi:hypothetical protein
MPDLSAVLQAVEEFARQPITAWEGFPKSENEAFQVPCFGSLFQLCHGAPGAVSNEALRSLRSAIAEGDIYQASRVATVCGTLVEFGGDPAITAGAIIERLPQQLALAAQVAGRLKGEAESKLFAEAPEAFKAWKGLRFMLLPAMAMLCRNRNLRQVARREPGLVEGLEALEGAPAEVEFLRQVLSYTDDLELIVLHLPQGKGFRVSLEAVNTNFHLFTLLQAALVGDPDEGMLAGAPGDPEVIAVATGEVPHTKLLNDSARWHYYDWRGLMPDGTLGFGATIWGEASPRDIPTFEGEPVVLIGPPVFGMRMWDSNFFANIHDALRSRVEVVEVLSADDVAGWLLRIQEAGRPTSGD